MMIICLTDTWRCKNDFLLGLLLLLSSVSDYILWHSIFYLWSATLRMSQNNFRLTEIRMRVDGFSQTFDSVLF